MTPLTCAGQLTLQGLLHVGHACVENGHACKSALTASQLQVDLAGQGTQPCGSLTRLHAVPMISVVQAEGSAALTFAAAVVVTAAVLSSMLGRPRHRLKGRHVMITGGSEGIGLSLALEMALRGAAVSLLSRTQAKLDAAAKQLRAAVKDCAVHTFAADVMDYAQARSVSTRTIESVVPFCALCVAESYLSALFVVMRLEIIRWQVCKAVAAAQQSAGRVDLLVCCAGTSVPGEACGLSRLC